MALKFENKKIWQTALTLCGEISEMVKAFPKDELFSITSQIKRVAASVLLTITEGSTLHSNAEFRRFLMIANRSGLEVIGCLYLARQIGCISTTLFEDKYQKYQKLIADYNDTSFNKISL